MLIITHSTFAPYLKATQQTVIASESAAIQDLIGRRRRTHATNGCDLPTINFATVSCVCTPAAASKILDCRALARNDGLLSGVTYGSDKVK